jgi:hypothetical protein
MVHKNSYLKPIIAAKIVIRIIAAINRRVTIVPKDKSRIIKKNDK